MGTPVWEWEWEWERVSELLFRSNLELYPVSFPSSLLDLLSLSPSSFARYHLPTSYGMASWTPVVTTILRVSRRRRASVACWIIGLDKLYGTR